MNAWPLLAVLGAVSFALRSIVVLVAGERELPDWFLDWCTLVAPGIVAALVGGSLVQTAEGGLTLVEALPLLAGIATAIRTGSASATLVAGLTTHLAAGALIALVS